MPPIIPAPIKTNANGRANAADSTPAVLSNEDFAKLEAIRAILANGSTSAKQDAILAKMPTPNADGEIPVRESTSVVDCSFVRSGSGLLAAEVEQLGPVGSGMTVGQAYSNLNIDTGTSPGAEFLFRSLDSVSGAHSLRYRLSVSQKIVNQHNWAMLADLIGEDVPFSTDATGRNITVTLPAGHGLTSENVGQCMMLGGVNGAALSHPGRYAITAVSGDNITFSAIFDCTWTRSTTTATVSFQGGAPIYSLNEQATVSASSDTAAIVNGVVTLLTQSNGNNLATATFTCLNAGATSGTLKLAMTAKAWTPSASGTLTVYGWNYMAIIRNGTSATAAWKDTQRKGWSSGAATMTKTTDAPPLGVVDQLSGDTQIETFSDITPASQSTSLSANGRATAVDCLPPKAIKLYFFFSVSNGVTAPASTTRFSLGFFRILDLKINKVQVQGFDQSGYGQYADVRVSSFPSNTGFNAAQVNGGTWATATPATNRAAAVAFGAPASNADVASAARTATGNSGTIADDFAGATAYLLAVTAVSGTSPTLDVVISESYDNGTTWNPTWHFPRVTANTTLRCPALPTGGRRRIDWTIGGTTPSFTFSVTAMRGSQTAPVQRQFFDRTAGILAGTVNSVTPWFDIAGLKSFNFRFTAGAITTTPGQYQIELSDDGVNPVASGAAVAAAASATVVITPASGAVAGFARLKCTVAASGQTGTHASFYGTN